MRHHFLNDENRSNFRKSRRKFGSNMSKIVAVQRTSPSKGSASLSSTTVQTPWRTRGRVMMFLIRTAFWLSVVVLVLPTPQSMKVPESNIGTSQAVGAASAAVSHMGQFCARQPDACKVGSQALTQFGYKAQASAKWVYEFLTDKLGPGPARSGAAQPTRTAPAPARPSVP